MQERIAAVEQVAASSHKRIDGVDKRFETVDKEILKLRDARHDHANEIMRHTGYIENHEAIIKGISTSVDKLIEAVTTFKAMAVMGLFMGGGFIAFCGFVGGKLMEWW